MPGKARTGPADGGADPGLLISLIQPLTSSDGTITATRCGHLSPDHNLRNFRLNRIFRLYLGQGDIIAA